MLSNHYIFTYCVLFIAACGPAKPGSRQIQPDAGQPRLSFNKDIEPILNKACSACHHDGGKAPIFMGSEELFRRYGPVVVASVAERDAKRRMPPARLRAALTPAEQAKLIDFLALPPGPPEAEAAAPTPFDRDIRPILVKACGSCHTQGGKPPTLETGDDLRNAAAEVWASINRPDDKGRMPPQRTRPAGLSAADKATLKAFLGL